jgi:hypothetical protein
MPAALARDSLALPEVTQKPLPTYTITFLDRSDDPCHIRQRTDSDWPGMHAWRAAAQRQSAAICVSHHHHCQRATGPLPQRAWLCVSCACTYATHACGMPHRHLVATHACMHASKWPPGAPSAHLRSFLHPVPDPSPHTAPSMTHHVQPRYHKQPDAVAPDKPSNPIRHSLQYTVATCPCSTQPRSSQPGPCLAAAARRQAAVAAAFSIPQHHACQQLL